MDKSNKTNQISRLATIIKYEKRKKLAYGIAFGIVFGTVIGVLTNNIGLWLSVGIAIGAGVGNSLMKKGSKKDNGDASTKFN